MRSGIRIDNAPRALRQAGGLLSVLVALCGAAVPAFATNYYVNPSGNDGNAGTSSGAPWATIGKANNTLRAGDVVFISPGTYADAVKPTASA
jgi:hypothetical protein